VLSILKVKQPVIFTIIMGLLGNSREIAVWDEQAIAKATGRSTEQRKGMLLYREKGEVGRGCYKQKGHWCKLGI